MADGTEVAGLYRKPGTNTYRVKATGQEFTEHDERMAVIRFRKLTANAADVVTLPGNPIPLGHSSIIYEPQHVAGEVRVDSVEFWQHVRETLLSRPFYVAERTGLPQLASFHDLNIPGPSIKLTDLLDLYATKTVKRETARKTVVAVKELMAVTGATTLRELTTEALRAYKKQLRESGRGTESMHGRFRRVKAVISYGKEDGLNTTEIDACLSRCKLLNVPKVERKKAQPNPILPEQFRALLAGASDELRAVLLLSLNCCLYLSECLAVEWKELDLRGGFYVSERSKTGVVRAATLWPETVAALQALPRRGQSPYVWTSNRGGRYNVNSYRDKFNRLCDAVGVNVEFNSLRDGAYTAACAEGVEFHLAQILAGHEFIGQSNDYIQRSPRQTKPATDAIYSHYVPFPDSQDAVRIGRPSK